MGQCDRIDYCTYFTETMKHMPATAEMYQKNFCQGNSDDCARKILYRYLEKRGYELNGEEERMVEQLSTTLAPNDRVRVQALFPDSL